MSTAIYPEIMNSDDGHWIGKNIHMRVCKICGSKPSDLHNAIPGKRNRSCICGAILKPQESRAPMKRTYLVSSHQFSSHDSGVSSSHEAPPHNEDWVMDKHSRVVPTNAFGEIEFVGNSESKKKYIRVSPDEDIDSILKLMTEKWGLEKPNLLLSVTGGAQNFNLKKKLKDEFKRGLLKLARSAGVWIVTGGTNTGVMKHVGEAVRDYELTCTDTDPLVAIGIATWGCIKNRDDLVRKDKDSGPVQYSLSEHLTGAECYLDPHHTHFILVDDGSQYKFGVEIEFRAKLEKRILEMKTETSDPLSVQIPFIQLVLGGGIGTFSTVKETLDMNVPVVIVEETGRAAEVLTKVYNMHTSSSKKIRKLVTDLLSGEVSRESRMSKLVKTVSKIMQKRHLLTIFSVSAAQEDSVSEIDKAILQALLKSNLNSPQSTEDQVYSQLKLAMTWNRIDIARSEIISKNPAFDPIQLCEIIQLGIQMNRVDFVELLMELGIGPHQFINKSSLLVLYNYIPKSSLLCRMLMRVRRDRKNKSEFVTFVDIGYLIKELVGDSFFTKYREEGWLQYDSLQLTNDASLTIMSKKRNIHEAVFRMALGRSHNDSNVENPFQHLFLWAVLMNRQDMANMCWKHCKDHIATVLVGHALLEAMVSQTNDLEERNVIRENANEFSNIAWEVLCECYAVDDKKTSDLLMMPQASWDGLTCIDIAVYSDNKRFLSHTACQSLLNNIWMGNLSTANSAILILLCCLFPPFLPLLNYTDNMIDSADKHKSLGRQSNRRRTLKRQQSKIYQKTPWASEKEDPDSKPRSMSKIKKICDFFTAPIVVFTYNLLAYFAFLILHSYVILFYFEEEASVLEYILMAYVCGMILDELRQITSYTRSNVLSYFSEKWNIVDVTSFVFFIVGIVIRFVGSIEVARIILALNLIIFFCRVLHTFAVHKELGPKLVMIKAMFIDLMYFLIILGVFVVSYCIAGYAILFPNSELSYDGISHIARFGYWKIYGEPSLEMIELVEPDCSFNSTVYEETSMPRCPSPVGQRIVPILMAIYMLFSSVLLINLVIAMFSYTFKKVQDESDQHWHFLRYKVITEYAGRPILPPPFILLNHAYLIVRFIVNKCGRCSCGEGKTCCDCGKDNDQGREKFLSNYCRTLTEWESIVAEVYIQKKKESTAERIPQWAIQQNKRMDQLIDKIDQIQTIINLALIEEPSS